jgi:hypothetical protein
MERGYRILLVWLTYSCGGSKMEESYPLTHNNDKQHLGLQYFKRVTWREYL